MHDNLCRCRGCKPPLTDRPSRFSASLALLWTIVAAITVVALTAPQGDRPSPTTLTTPEQ